MRFARPFVTTTFKTPTLLNVGLNVPVEIFFVPERLFDLDAGYFACRRPNLRNVVLPMGDLFHVEREMVAKLLIGKLDGLTDSRKNRERDSLLETSYSRLSNEIEGNIELDHHGFRLRTEHPNQQVGITKPG